MLAAWSAVVAAVFEQEDLRPEGPGVAHFADGGGSEFDLALLSGGRASIVGFDREAGDTDLRGRDDLVAAGAPRWWFAALPEGATAPNFAYGFDGTSWSAVGHNPDLITKAHFTPGPATDPETAAGVLADVLSQAYEDNLDGDYPADAEAVEALLAAGEHIDEGTLRRALGGDYGDIALGVATAARFRR
ncbi:hypothetical protein GCM10009551_097790 [Nocardiopsis tropica]|nr:hypothetical protein TTY48_00790 [Tsukamurella sp. TY48]